MARVSSAAVAASVAAASVAEGSPSPSAIQPIVPSHPTALTGCTGGREERQAAQNGGKKAKHFVEGVRLSVRRRILRATNGVRICGAFGGEFWHSRVPPVLPRKPLLQF